MNDLIPTGNTLTWRSNTPRAAPNETDLTMHDLYDRGQFLVGSFIFYKDGAWVAHSRRQRAEFATKEEAMLWVEAIYAMGD